jgi:hypothetical protein
MSRVLQGPMKLRPTLCWVITGHKWRQEAGYRGHNDYRCEICGRTRRVKNTDWPDGS